MAYPAYSRLARTLPIPSLASIYLSCPRRPVKKHGGGFGAPVLADLVFVDTSRVKVKFSDAII
ncbi:MAG: hypothetical protein JRI38_05375, partial [Deltaproteobacteria bacterium]|nr:hypothetical protein [Deltaproteobacteria bacterium]